jgi:ribokinase
MTSRMHRVVCVGDVMVDVLAQLPHALAVGSDTPAPIRLLGGGSAANTAAWLIRAGVPTTFVGRVGDDVLGRMAVDELAAAGIDLVVSVDPTRPTGTCIVLVDRTGERTMVPAAGANSGLGEAELATDLMTAETHLHISAYALFNPGARGALDLLTAQARAVGASVSIDAASAAPLADFGADNFLAWLADAAPGALVFANHDEAVVLTGEHADAPPESLARWIGSHTGEAIVKCGAAGAVWSDGDRVESVDTEPVTAVDSTGAGDAFAAGVLGARATQGDVVASLRAGNALAASAITQAGGRP